VPRRPIASADCDRAGTAFGPDIPNCPRTTHSALTANASEIRKGSLTGSLPRNDPTGEYAYVAGRLDHETFVIAKKISNP
jgi:hypothetical protein